MAESTKEAPPLSEIAPRMMELVSKKDEIEKETAASPSFNGGDTADTDHKYGSLKPGSNAADANPSANAKPPLTFSERQTRFVNQLRRPILFGMKALCNLAARNPKRTIGLVVLLSFAVLGIGLATNFNVQVDRDELWAPNGSYARKHLEWIQEDSGFPAEPELFLMTFHRDSRNVVTGRDPLIHIFTALDGIRNLPGYKPLCGNVTETGDCPISGVTRFWGHQSWLLAFTGTDEAAIYQMSQTVYPFTQTPVSDDDIFGKAVRNETTNLLISAQAFMYAIDLPSDVGGSTQTFEFEKEALDYILKLGESWEKNPDIDLRVEVLSEGSFNDEFERAILDDIPLVPIVFVAMATFTSMIFFRRDKVQSRSLLGITAVLSVLLSIVCGYGILFLIGVSFTSMTQILPYIFFGVGLDDAFIITGSFMRLDPEIDPVERVQLTVEDVGLSVFLTTLTSTLAFALGCVSSVPAVLWLCLYAVPTMILILLFQLTFFVACLVLDERRIAARTRDILRCVKCQCGTEEPSPVRTTSTVDRLMRMYGELLMQPRVKLGVVFTFVVLLAGFSYSATKLKLDFSYRDVIPDDSYVGEYFDVLEGYTTRTGVLADAYFRRVDQSSPQVRLQMDEYINALVGMASIENQPDHCWFRDFESFINDTNVADLHFAAQVDLFLSDTRFNDLYVNDIVRDEAGFVVSSRCQLFMDNVRLGNAILGIETLEEQRQVTKTQPVNKGHDDFLFFSYGRSYAIWEFLSIVSAELVLTTVLSIVAVTFVTFLLVPHWTAGFIVLVFITVLYIDLLGFIQAAGISIDPVSYISLVMSIGLMVDYLLHVLLRFFEEKGSRREKTLGMLETMGSSIVIGGLTTLLGTIPLAFSKSTIFKTVFILFLGLVLLGTAHGLILLPVVLSTVGPEVDVSFSAERSAGTGPKTSSETSPNYDGGVAVDDNPVEVYA